MKKTAILVFLAVAFWLISGTSNANPISLAWDPSVSDNVTGYVVYFRETGTYKNNYYIDVGDVLEYTITEFDFEYGKSYCFYATAYDEWLQSETSKKIYCTVGIWMPITIKEKEKIPEPFLATSLIVSWMGPKKNVSDYEITYWEEGKFVTTERENVKSDLQVSIGNLERGKTYLFRLKAYYYGHLEATYPLARYTVPIRGIPLLTPVLDLKL